MKLLRLLVVALLAWVVLVPAPVAAQSGKDDARRFFNAGQKAFKAGRYVEAAKAFEEAFRIKPHPAPLINAGDAWEKAGQVAVAARSYQRVLTLEQAGEQDRSDATDRLAKIAPRVGIFELDGEKSVRARVDQDEFHGGDRVYVDPGEHTVTLLDIDGAKERKIDVAAGASRTIEFTTLMPEKPKPSGVESGAGTKTDGPAEGDQGPTKKGGVRAGTWLMFGLTAVAAGGAVYFGLQVNDAEKKFNANPNRDDFDRFNKDKLYTNVGIGVAVVSAGVGTFLLIKDLNRKVPATSSRVRHPPALGFDALPMRGGGMLVGSGRF